MSDNFNLAKKIVYDSVGSNDFEILCLDISKSPSHVRILYKKKPAFSYTVRVDWYSGEEEIIMSYEDFLRASR